MTSFNATESGTPELDFTIVRDGGISLYRNSTFLDEDLALLRLRGYRAEVFDAAEWRSDDQMHEQLQNRLGFPDYYGRNFGALDECICDDLVVPDSGGLIIVLQHYDQLAAVQRDRPDGRNLGEVVLDIFARASRHHMLFGRRLVVLVQSDDPAIQFGRLGGAAPVWNRREWQNKNRGL